MGNYRTLPIIALLCFFIACEEPVSLKKETTSDTPIKSGIDFDEDQAKTFDYPFIKVEKLNKAKLVAKEDLFSTCMNGKSIEDFRWSQVSDHTLFSAIQDGQGLVEIGFKDRSFKGMLYKEDNYDRYNTARNYILEFILREKRKNNPAISIRDLEIQVPNAIPVIWIKIEEYSIIAKLRKLKEVRYVEPQGISIETLAPVNKGEQDLYTLGGDCATINDTFFERPFLNRGFNSIVSWHLYQHRIPEAWALSTGEGISIGIVDTGISPDQRLLRPAFFNTGLSSGRTIENHNLVGNLIDFRNHGTSVIGTAAGPVNNDGAITGVAYQSSIVSYRVSSDPWIGTTRSKNAFIEALENLGRNSAVKVINMSVGRFHYRSSMEDAVNYAFSRGKLLVCSSGITGDNGALYPALFENTVAVTSVPFVATDPLGINLTNLSPNPFGNYIHFAGYLRRNTDGACALSLNGQNAEPSSNLGSSKAAALVSGIAALVWSANPQLTREEVMTILANAASYQRFQNTRDANFGFGIIDARFAVEEALAMNTQCRDLGVSISGPYELPQNGRGTWRANVSGSCANNVTYRWYNSAYGTGVVGTSPTYSAYLNGQNNHMVIKCIVSSNNVSKTASRSVFCTNCNSDCLAPMVMDLQHTNNQLQVKLAAFPCPLSSKYTADNAIRVLNNKGRILKEIPIYNQTDIKASLNLPEGKYQIQLYHNGLVQNKSFKVLK